MIELENAKTLRDLLMRMEASGQSATTFTETLRAAGATAASLRDLRKCAYVVLELVAPPRLAACARRVIRASMEAQVARAAAITPRMAEIRERLLKWAAGSDDAIRGLRDDVYFAIGADDTAAGRNVSRLVLCAHQVAVSRKLNVAHAADLTGLVAEEAAVDDSADTERVAWATLLDACREVDEYATSLDGIVVAQLLTGALCVINVHAVVS